MPTTKRVMMAKDKAHKKTNCHDCGKPKPYGKMYCTKCLRTRKEARLERDRLPCRRCGVNPKLPGRASQFCQQCQDERQAKKLCQQCGLRPKKPGQGQRLCEKCVPIGWNARKLGQRPCRKCGTTENKLPKKQHCEECRELLRWQQKRRHAAAKVVNRHPCERCGGLKGPGSRRRYCDACKRALAAPRTCTRCGQHPVLVKYAKICAVCKYEAAELVKARNREYEKRRRNDPVIGPKIKARKKVTERQKKEQANERARMGHRLRNGFTVAEGQTTTGAGGHDLVSAAPLYPHLQMALRRAAAEQQIDTTKTRAKHPGLGALAARVGVSEKAIARILEGQQNTTYDVADKIATALDLHIHVLYPLGEAA